jgi:hypothetical protein
MAREYAAGGTAGSHRSPARSDRGAERRALKLLDSSDDLAGCHCGTAVAGDEMEGTGATRTQQGNTPPSTLLTHHYSITGLVSTRCLSVTVQHQRAP